MSYTEIKSQIDSVRNQISRAGSLTNEQLKKINYKFRLEWNYNSNSMEGNTLTVDETRSVMVGNIDVHQKPYKDVAEMKGHDEVISEILKIGKGELRLSESRIKGIHKSIMHEEDEDKRVQIGVWKTIPNYIINRKKERYDFALPEEVPTKIHDLLNRTNAAIDALERGAKNAPHPIDIAFGFHLEFLDIHPFYDGNGRTARILTNLILISLGYTPFWINAGERDVYYAYLTDIQGYGGLADLLNEYMAGLLLRSEKLVLDVIEGRDIEAEDDLDKEISLWKRQFEKKEELIAHSKHVVAETYMESIRPLLTLYLLKVEQFKDVFNRITIKSDIDGSSQSYKELERFDEIFNEILEEYKENNTLIYTNSLQDISLNVFLEGFKNNGINTFNVFSKIYISFNKYNYEIGWKGNSSMEENVVKLYSEVLSQNEISAIVSKVVLKLFNEIKGSIKE